MDRWMKTKLNIIEIVYLFFGLPLSDKVRMIGKVISRYSKAIRKFFYE